MILLLIKACIGLANLIGGAELLTILPASRDSDAGRRFAKLPGKEVGTETDAERNARWHRGGAGQRAVDALLLSVAVVGILKEVEMPHSWWLVLPGFAVAGGWMWRRFDRAFAVRFGQHADYLGTTAASDRISLAHTDLLLMTSPTLRVIGTATAILGAIVWLAVICWLAP